MKGDEAEEEDEEEDEGPAKMEIDLDVIQWLSEKCEEVRRLRMQRAPGIRRPSTFELITSASTFDTFDVR